MDGNRPDTDDFSELRRRAEERLTQGQDDHNPQASASEVELRRLIHELSVHQIELEMQKDELLHTAEDLAQSRMELQKGLERYTDLYDFAPVGYLTLARDSRILDANLTAVIMLGVERAVLKGDCFARFVADEDRPVFNAMMELVFGSSVTRNCQLMLRPAGRLGGQPEDVVSAKGLKTVRMDAVISEDGQVCRVALSDISRQKEVEQENASLQEDLAQAQKMDSIGRLAGGIAHDFNNMLSVILCNTEMALRMLDPSHPMREELEAILKAASRSAELTRQLLAFARKQTVIPKILDMDSAVETSLAMVRRLIGENIVVDWLPAGEGGYVNMDPTQIDQILINLCVNARDAITGDGRITIRTGRTHVTASDCSQGHCCKTPGDYVTLSVADNGCGIDKTTLHHIFEPFFTTKEHGRGTGLGLSTVYGIVKQNFGYIECTSQPGKGTAFIIHLPRYNDVVPDGEHVTPSERIQSGKGAILIVEDEPDILGFIKRILESKGYSVHAALTPVDAIRMVSEYRDEIQLLLTDVVMPGVNGGDLAHKLKSMIPGLKIIFMSGYTADVVAGCGVLDDGVNYIQKPFSLSTLAMVVERVLKT